MWKNMLSILFISFFFLVTFRSIWLSLISSWTMYVWLFQHKFFFVHYLLNLNFSSFFFAVVPAFIFQLMLHIVHVFLCWTLCNMQYIHSNIMHTAHRITYITSQSQSQTNQILRWILFFLFQKCIVFKLSFIKEFPSDVTSHPLAVQKWITSAHMFIELQAPGIIWIHLYNVQLTFHIPFFSFFFFHCCCWSSSVSSFPT